MGPKIPGGTPDPGFCNQNFFATIFWDLKHYVTDLLP